MRIWDESLVEHFSGLVLRRRFVYLSSHLVTVRALRRWNAGQKFCGVAEIFLGSVEGWQSACWSRNCSWMCGSVPSTPSTRLLLSCTKVKSYIQVLKNEEFIQVYHLTSLEYSPHFTFFLMLLMVSCFKWDTTNSGDMLFCTFFTWGMWKSFLQLEVHLVRRISDYDFEF